MGVPERARRRAALAAAAVLHLAASGGALWAPSGRRAGESGIAPVGFHADAPKFAFVTLVATPSWIRGAQVLGCSLRKFAQSRHIDMVAFCYNLTGDVAKVEEAGWRCSSPNLIENPKHNQWVWDFTQKIVPFSMTQYDRVVVMDSDMVVVDPEGLGSLFEMPFPEGNIMAVPDCAAHFFRWTPEQSSYMIQGGLIVLRPSHTTYEAVKAAVGKVKSLDGGAQGFVSPYFRGNVTWLPAKFNYIRETACVSLINRTSGFYEFGSPGAILSSKHVEQTAADTQAWEDLRSGRIVVAHFHFRPKPWECNPLRPRACGMRWVTGSTRVDAIYHAWSRIDGKCSSTSATPNVAAGLL